MSPPAPNKSLRHQADRTARTRRLRRSGAPKDRCVRTGSPREGAAGFSAPRLARPRQPRAAGSVSPAPPRSPSRSAQPLPPPRRLGHPRSPFLALSGFCNCSPDQAARARTPSPGGAPAGPATPCPTASPSWESILPRGMAHRRRRPGIPSVAARRGHARKPHPAGNRFEARGCGAPPGAGPPRTFLTIPKLLEFPSRRPLREDGYLFAALALCAPARARALYPYPSLSLHTRLSLSLSLQKLDLYRSRPRCHRRQTVMKSKENQLPDWRWGRDSASACARRRAARCNCCSQRAWGAGRRGSRV